MVDSTGRQEAAQYLARDVEQLAFMGPEEVLLMAENIGHVNFAAFGKKRGVVFMTKGAVNPIAA